MSVTIRLRRGTASQWSSNGSTVLASGEPGYEIDTGRFKIGNGTTAWSGLAYAAIVPSGFLSGSGISISLDPNGSFATISTTGVSFSGHTHTASNITDFNSAVSGLLPTISNSGDNRIVTSTGSSLGLNAENNLTFDGTNLIISSGLTAATGNFTTSLRLSNVDVSVSGHTHISSNITDFGTAVSGLLPVKNILAGTGISISSTTGVYTITSTGSGVLSDQAKSLVTTVFNNTGSSIAKMTAVYINGGQGDTATIQKAIATGDLTSAGTYGLTYQNIDNMSTGQVIVFGAITGVNTDQFNPTAPAGNINGTVLYLSPTISGALTTTKPSAPNHIVAIGTVVRTHQNEGVIEVRVQNGFELDELHNVAISGVTNGQFLQYNSASGLWLASSSGNFTTLQVNGTGVSVSGHSHSLSGLGAAAYQDTNVFPSYNDPGQSSVTVAAGLWDPANALSWLHGFDGEVYIESFFVDSFRNSISAAPSSHSHGNITNSGAIGSASGLLVITTTSGLLTTTSGVSSSYITNFNTAVSGLLPTVTNSGDNRILTSTGSSVGVNAESNLTYDGSALKLYPGNEYPSITLVSDPSDVSDGINPISWYVTTDDLNTNIAKIDVSTESSPSEGMLVFHTNDGTSLQERVRITDIGRVGIGTSTPLSSLQVVGLITANSGNFTNSLQLNGTSVSISGHSHTISDISTFTSSGLAARISDETGSGLLVFNDSPTLTGVPLTPTAASGTNTNQIASTAFVRTEISNLVASAPTTLDTLNELAIALGNDANFSTTVTNNLAGKANLSGATFSGTISAPTGNFTGNVNIASQTASTIAGFDASKNVTSLSTSTYPSLTELSYVKGATSALQTQINSKQNSLTNPVTGTGVASHVAYWNSASGIVADSGQLYWDETNNRLGIGTSSPTGQLHVIGTGIFSSALLVNGVNVSVSGHSHTSSNITDFNSAVSGLVSGVYVPVTRTITPGSGLVGSSALDLSANRTIDIGQGDGLTVSADSIAVNSTVVRTTGNQTITGEKLFRTRLYANSGITVGLSVDGGYLIGNMLDIPYGDSGWTLASFDTALNVVNNSIKLNAVTTFNKPAEDGALPFIISPTGYTGSGAVIQGYWRGETIEVNKGGTGRTNYTNGQILIGSGTGLAANTLTAGTGINIINGSGTITISTSGLTSSNITDFREATVGSTLYLWANFK